MISFRANLPWISAACNAVTRKLGRQQNRSRRKHQPVLATIAQVRFLRAINRNGSWFDKTIA
jgi:hypothetical protein